MPAPRFYSYQEDAVEALHGSDRDHYLAFEPSLGKTKVALDLARRRGVRRLLIVCPLTVSLAWLREIKKWWPDAPPVTILSSLADAGALSSDGLFLSTYGVFSRRDPVFDQLVAAAPFGLTVLDEAHRLTNTGAKRTRGILLDMRKRLGRVLPMSATPAPNHAGELYPILRVVRSDLIRSAKTGQPMREDEFWGRYVEMRSIWVNDRQIDVVAGSKNVSELRQRLGTFFIRETKKRVLKDLPPLAFDVLPVEVDASQLPKLRLHGDDDDALHAVQASPSTVRRELGLAKAPMVAEWVRDWLDGASGRQMVVWAIHHEVIDFFVKMLLDFGVVKLDGRDSLKARDAALTAFQAGKARVFVGQIQAGGEGLNELITPNCSDEVFAESSFTPWENYQAACRIHRIGQQDAVLARFASAAGTFDDRIQEILARKARDFTELFENNPDDGRIEYASQN